jgi:hypothetical protein
MYEKLKPCSRRQVRRRHNQGGHEYSINRCATGTVHAVRACYTNIVLPSYPYRLSMSLITIVGETEMTAPLCGTRNLQVSCKIGEYLYNTISKGFVQP